AHHCYAVHPIVMQFILTSLVSAIMMGAGDFFGGVAAKRSPVALVGLFGQGIGLVLVAAIILFRAQTLSFVPFTIDLGQRISGSFDLLGCYRGLAIGRVTVVAPLSAVLGALIPVVVSIFTGHDFAPVKWIGIVSGLVAVYFLSLPSKEKPSRARDEEQPKDAG